MIQPVTIKLFHVPEQQYVEAQIVSLTPEMADDIYTPMELPPKRHKSCLRSGTWINL